jgi:uncharacterized integral membrane protein
MTLTIPIWLFWVIGIPLGVAVLICAAVGFLFIKNWDGIQW